MKLDSTSMTFGGSALTVRKTAVDAPKAKTMSDAYAEHSKIVFLFDVSGSMDDKVVYDRNGSSYADQFAFTPERLTEIGEACARAVNKAMAAEIAAMNGGSEDPGYDDFESLCSQLCRESLWDAPVVPTEDQIKERIIRRGKADEFGIPPAVGANQQPLSRIDIVKKLAKAEIVSRFRKYPKARVAVIAFGGNATVLFDDGDGDAAEAAVAKLDTKGMDVFDKSGQRVDSVDHGDTKILKAVQAGMDVCRLNPSAVGVHHFILVTDGGDGDANCSMPAWVPNLKASGVVIDYIHIGDRCSNDGIRAACVATGGEFVVCNTEKDISEKFTLAAARLCLPPAPDKK